MNATPKTTAPSSKTFESIYTTEGKDKLREEIRQLVNEKRPHLNVIAIYYAEVVVQ